MSPLQEDTLTYQVSCRLAQQRQMSIQKLPQLATDIIFEHVEASDGFHGILCLRLVSKAWLAAVREYPGSAELDSDLKELDSLLRIMPRVTKLSLCSHLLSSKTINLSPLAQCKQLTSLELFDGSGGYESLTINVVGSPNSFRELGVCNLRLGVGSFNNAASSITSLKLQRTKSVREDEWEWVQNLPNLKVRFTSF